MILPSAFRCLPPFVRSLTLCLVAHICGLAKSEALPVFETVHTFELCPKTPEAKLVLGNDGNFYGTTSKGGSNDEGTVFRMTPSGTVTTLVNFAGINGSTPTGGLLLANDGNFYGTTSGGASGYGTVFRMTPAGALTTIANFGNPNGNKPQSVLLQGSDGNFYGTTTHGGSVAKGTVFRMTPEGTLTTLTEFTGPNGSHPKGGLIEDANGNLYGTTQSGGAGEWPTPQGPGTIFRLTRQGTLTTLVNFSIFETGGFPSGELILGNDGNFYGATGVGGAGIDKDGTIFRMTPNGTLTTLVNFNQETMGGAPTGLTLGSDGNFYGTTQSGRRQGPYGTVFKVTPGGLLTTIADFNRLNGSRPLAGLVQGPDGVFYGTTSLGRSSFENLGSEEYGTLFKVTPGGELTRLNLFTDANGKTPSEALTQGDDGYLYGSTTRGGTYNLGTLFRITHGGALTTLVNFNKANGSVPEGKLVQGPNGMLYGTTTWGGISDKGTVFSLSPEGSLTTLTSFHHGGGASRGSVTVGDDGNLYGTTHDGGSHDKGTIYTLTPQGSLTTLVNFIGPNGSNPAGILLLANDGNFYGTTSRGGSSDFGTLFRMAPNGVLNTLVSFTGPNGRSPYSGLIQASDGNLYGSTTSGTSGFGTVFRMTLAGNLVTLANFTNTSSGSPQTGLVEAGDGNFYGLATGNDTLTGVFGEVFQVTPQGALTTVKMFFGPDGANTWYGALVQGSDGNLYGTTTSGGGLVSGRADGGGQIFRLRMDQVAAPDITVEAPDNTLLTSSNSSVTFGSTPVSFSNSMVFRINSVGTADLKNIAVATEGPDAEDFSIEVPPASQVAASTGTTTFSVRFTPKAVGPRTASLHIASNDSDENPFNIAITGTGIPGAPEITVEAPDNTSLIGGIDSVPFGSINVGSSQSTTLKIGNIGTVDLKDITVAIDGEHTADFSIQTPPASQVAGGTGTTTFTIRFAPQATGIRTAALHIGSNDSDENPFDLLLTGIGAQFTPEISISQPTGSNLTDGSAKKSFGTVKIGKKSVSKAFTIKNTGTAPLTGLAVSIKGHTTSFIIVPPAKTTLAPGASTNFKVSFSPKVKGSLKAALLVKSNDKDESPFDIKLSGFGVKP